ncbi:MAG: transglycosylase SLT domain-containing protein [Aestuariivirga sp.]
MVPTRDDVARRASELGVDPRLALAIFNQESGGNFNSKDSPRNARGGFQVVPGTYKAMMGTDAGQRDAWNNMEAGLRYLAHGKKVLGTDDPVLLASGYHAGYERKDLKAGRIPGTNDGMISTADYARSVAARVRGSRQPASRQPNLADQFTDTPEAAITPSASDFVDSLEEAKSAPQVQAAPGGQAAAIEPLIDIENKPYLDRLTEETKSGFGDMTRSLTTARWALGAGDAKSLAEDLAKSIQEQSSRPKTKAQQEIDAAYQGVTDAKGVIDTTAAGAKALWASLTNPKETSIEIARNAANSLPTLGAGAAGAAAGGAAGSVIPGAGTLAGAIAGGRTGMALGTTATELGAEIQDMVQKRLTESKQPPTAQNVLAILSDKDFQSQALKQGAAKGLTVAAVDQLFMGLGGKIATAPARKVATQELAEQGMDMATRGARNKALASPAGQAAIAAAKPALGARVGAGAAAVGVDAAGESLGEGLSQQVARGEVDYGEALREGVVSIGQSAAQTAVGATIESAKVAARAAKGAMQPTAAAPSTASGPLARATENAAAEPERVTVTAPDGQVTGTVTGQTDGGVQVVGDDGQVYHFATGPNGVQITPEAPNTPLSNAVEVAAGEVAVEPQAPAAEAPQEAAPPVEAAQPEPAPAPEQPKALADLTEPELRERLKYIKQQAKPANGGWNKMLTDERKLVEREIDARTAQDAKLPQAQAPAQPTTLGTQVNVEAGPGFTAETMGLNKSAAEFTDTQAEALAAPEAAPVTQPAPPVATTEEGVGASQPPQAAPVAESEPAKKPADGTLTDEGAKPTPSKAALDRIAKGTAFFGDKAKAQAFITKNGLADTHTVEQTGKVRFDVKPKEQPNVADQRPQQQPAGTEAVGQEADAGQAAPAAVQPDAAVQEVSPVLADKLVKKAEANEAKADRIEAAGGDAQQVESLREQAERDRVTAKQPKPVTVTKAGAGATAIIIDPSATTLAGRVRQARAEAKADVSKSAAEIDTTAKPVEAPAKSDPFANNTLFTSDRVAAARERLKKKLSGSQFNSGIDPELLMDGIIIAGGHIESGTRAFTAYAKAMIDDLGDGVKPYLLSFYEAARNYPGLDTQGMTSVSDAKAEFDKLIQPADLEKAQEAIGEIAPKPAKRTKKTGAKADMTLTQDWGVEQIDGYGDGTREAGNALKDAFLKETTTYLKAVADVLTQRGFMVHERSGKPMKAVSANESGMATSGSVSLALRLPDAGSGIYVHIGETSLRGIAPTTQSGIAVMFRATTENDPYGGKQNRWAPTDLSAADFADMLEKEARQNATEKRNGPQELDQPRPRELAGEQPDAVQGTQPQRQAGPGAEAGGGANARGDERAGSAGSEQPGRLGDDAREVPAAAAGEGSGRGGEPGRRAVQRGERPAKPDPATGNRELGNQPELTPESGTRAQDRADGFTITDADAIGEGGAKTKYKQNVAAIRLLKELTAANRQATRAEQAVLAKYVGWGGIPQAFYRDNNEVSKGWEKEAAELKALLTADELAAAAASTRNAHYTSTEIVSAIWTALRHFGFKGGRVLEPSVGAGNFFGLMPGALRSASQLTGVELDHITGGIAKQLYPQANIQAPVGFQDFSAPDNYFDVATGNPPFGAEGIYDAMRRKISGFSIHNYFFAKSIDTVKPNGVLAMVVTNRLLDSTGDKARQYIASRSEFLGAIRLPNDAFLKNAGTAVTTDIIFLRKLKDGEAPTGQSWMDVKQVTDKTGKTVPLNEYFVRNPDMMLGEFGAYGSMYRPDDAALVARPGQDTPALLAAAIAKLPQGFMDGPTAEPTRETVEPLTDISRVKVGSVFEQGGKIFERTEDMLGKQQAKEVTFASDKARERVVGMIQVRDALIAVRGLQLTDGVSEKALESARAGLNKAYDAFVKENGPLNADANKRLMRDDPTWPQLAALEEGFDKGITPAVAKTTGETPRKPSAKKAAIFSKRTQAPYHAPTQAASAKDALVSSLSERGRVDLDYMAGLYGKTPEAIARELDGLIFEVVPGDYVTREEYLSGNVKKLLALTLQLAEKIPRFQKNVEALRAVQPADIEAVDIDVKTGAHWIPADVMEGFVSHITEGNRIKAFYNPLVAAWKLDAEQISNAAFTQYSTDRTNIIKVLEAAANQKQIQVFDEDRRAGTRTLNEAATTAANAKVDLVKSAWKNWIWADDARRTRLTRIYNDTFNTDVQREFDGSHLTFPGKVGDDIIQLRPHQANAVWRMVQSGTTLLDHVVGAGKTFTMIAGIMEMRRMGLAKKPMLVVPNHLVGQWATDFMKLYPGANILAATKKDFEKDSRKKLFARIATGDWDAVIVAHSSFGKVEVEPEFQEAFIREQITDMDISIGMIRAAEGKGSRNVKQIEKQKAALEEKLKRLFDTGAKDDNLYFSELGVDAVLLDEAHEFKNLGFSTGMQRVAGLGNPVGSNKAADMFMKVQSVLKRTGGRNMVFATGTPISNTMAEMYTMQRYLDYGTLKDQGIAHFVAWAKTFGEVVTDWELSPSGQYKMNSRFAKFVNMPELMQRYGSFADVINRDDINRQLAAQGKKLPVPKLKGGKPENTVVERSQDQARYIGIPTVDENGVESYPQGSLIWRSENLPKKAEKGADNMLKIMSDARKAALDMRLIDPNYPDNPGSKVNVAAGNIKAIYDKWTADKGTQLVFIDLSTPKGAVAKEAAALRELVSLAEQGDEAAQEKLDAMSPDELLALDSSFSVYDDLKAKLIGLGIPENEVAFIHDANTELQKEELFAKVRSGRIRVLLGSTAKMGAGMNVQDRLVALHHLDAPWRPSDLEQREGRIIRQGNKLYEADPENFEVEIKRYATKQTLDSRMWQTIEAKARFIEQVRKGTGQREVEDVAGEAANSAEMKAASSGNPLILEEMSLRQAIRKLENGQSEHNREQFRIKDQMRWVGESAKRADAEAAIMEADAPKAPKAFAVTIGNQTFDKHGEAGEAILAAVDAMHAAGEDTRDIGSYGRFALTLDDTTLAGTKKAVLTIKGQGEYQIEANPGSATTGLALRLQNTVKELAEAAATSRAKAERNRADIPKLEAQIKPWGQEQELADAKARHAAVIDQLKPKKKPADEAPAMSRAELEPIFKALEGRGLTRKRALDSLANLPEAAKIEYIENNFVDILEELNDSNLVDIKC